MVENLRFAEKVINGSKINKFLSYPIPYLFNFLFQKTIYPIFKKGIILSRTTFFGSKIYINLPAAADIFIFGSKSHSSEIRLSKFMIKNLEKGDSFVDVGAHIGFYSLLAQKLVQKEGQIYSYEASKNTFELLYKNCHQQANIKLNHKACSDNNESISFYEFPLLYSEYNSIDLEQYKNEAWFKNNPPQKNTIQAVVLDNDLPNENIKIIKIDVEGAEFKVVKGISKLLEAKKIKYIALEYLNDNRDTSNHFLAIQFLIEKNYFPFRIDENGEIQKIENNNIQDYLNKAELDSDNIVFKYID